MLAGLELRLAAPLDRAARCAPTPNASAVCNARGGRAKDLPSFGRGNGDRPNGSSELREKCYAAGGWTSAPSRLSGSADLVLDSPIAGR